MSDPVMKVINSRPQELYDIAMVHDRRFYEANESMCMAVPFLWEVNPHIADIYEFEPGTVIFVPSDEDHVRWRNANVRRFGQSAFIADPAR